MRERQKRLKKKMMLKMKGRYSPSREAVKKRLGEGVGLHEASGWRGYRLEGEVIHMGARLYHYPTARVLAADPLGHASDMSLYSYANNDPVNGVDPDGRCAKQVPSYTGNFVSPLPVMNYIPKSNEIFKINYSASEIRSWVKDAAAYHQVPHIMLATILQQENSPRASLTHQALQFFERQLTTSFALIDRILFDIVPDKIPNWFPFMPDAKIADGSSGFTNMSRPTLEHSAKYIEKTYDRSPMPQEVQRRVFDIDVDTRIPGFDWKADLYYTAGHIRELIDRTTGQKGFDANNLTMDQAQKVFEMYNGGKKYGDDSINLIQDAVDGTAILYFYEK
ncbi:MAG: hypothetical protein NZM04_08100 [Methylacidiphilales bacterium]|nr:hypothetical protein [Candidatus Methylacidiphilales bacterium]